MDALGSALGFPNGFASGSVVLAGSFEGPLRPGRPILAELTGLLDVEAREGEVRRKLPLVMAIAASQALNPFVADRESVRYDRIRSLLHFDHGRVRSDAFLLEGPDLRVLYSGELELVEPTRAIDAVVAVFYQGRLDRVISAIPLVNEIFRGSDDSLAAAYLQLSGPVDDPSVQMIPIKTFASLGPAGFVFEDVPKLLRSGFRALQKLFESDDEEDDDGREENAKPPFPVRRGS